MTSWVKAQSGQVKRKVADPDTFFQPTRGSISSNLIGLVYSVLYSLKQGETLVVYDHPNCVSETFPMFADILKGNANIRYLKSQPSSKNLGSDPQTMVPVLNAYRLSQMRQVAQDVFQLNDDAQRAVQSILESRSLSRDGWDVGVHIQAGDKEVPISNYISAVRLFQQRQNKKNLRVFVMTDAWKKWEEFKAAADPSWIVGSLIQKNPYTESGSDLTLFATLPETTRLRHFFELLADLQVMQRISYVVTTFSSHVGRLLYLINRTNPTSDAIVSLDVKTWSPL